MRLVDPEDSRRVELLAAQRRRLVAGQPRGGKNSSSLNVLTIVIVASFFLACMLGWKRFVVWESVSDYCGLDPFVYFQIPITDILSNPWGLRTGLAVPSLLLAEYTSLTQEQSFSLFAGGCVVCTALLVNHTAARLAAASPLRGLMVLMFFLTVGWFMNGRICFAFLGAAVLMHAHVHWITGRQIVWRMILANIAGLTLTVVSSGSFYVGCLSALTWFGLAAFGLYQGSRRTGFRPRFAIKMLPVIALAVYQGSLFEEKLQRWHEGDYWQILYHGPGKALEKYLPALDPQLALFGCVAILTTLLFCWLVLVKNHAPVWVYMVTVVTCSVAMGLCGYSTLFTNLPTMVLLMIYQTGRKTDFVSRHHNRRAFSTHSLARPIGH